MTSVIRFTCNDPSVVEMLDADVKRSSFSTRTKYLNALVGVNLSVEPGHQLSCLDQVLYLKYVYDHLLPMEKIKALARTQNRSVELMVKHMMDISLSYYPDQLLALQAADGASNLDLSSAIPFYPRLLDASQEASS